MTTIWDLNIFCICIIASLLYSMRFCLLYRQWIILMSVVFIEYCQNRFLLSGLSLMTAGAPGQAAPLLPPEGGHPQHLHLSPSPSSSSAQLSPGRGIEIIIAIYIGPPRRLRNGGGLSCQQNQIFYGNWIIFELNIHQESLFCVYPLLQEGFLPCWSVILFIIKGVNEISW